MSFVARALAPFITRPAKAGAVRRFDCAPGGRRAFGMGTMGAINSEAAAAVPRLNSTASYLALNNSWISQGVANWVAALVGPGIVPTPKHPDAATRKMQTAKHKGLWCGKHSASSAAGRSSRSPRSSRRRQLQSLALM